MRTKSLLAHCFRDCQTSPPVGHFALSLFHVPFHQQFSDGWGPSEELTLQVGTRIKGNPHWGQWGSQNREVWL